MPVPQPSTPPSFPLFPLLPLEVRLEIWTHALPLPRVLHILPTSPPTISPASYGLSHPSLLSVNVESRTVALSHLTGVFRVYWNLEIDYAYFECRALEDEAVALFADMRRRGELERFSNVAIDWNVWEWELATRTMEYRRYMGGMFDEYEHPIKTLNSLPNIKKVAFIYTEHTLQKDIPIPGSPWHLGILTSWSTLDIGWKGKRDYAMKELERRKGELERGGELEIRLLSIHDREREELPKDKLKRPIQSWEMD